MKNLSKAITANVLKQNAEVKEQKRIYDENKKQQNKHYTNKPRNTYDFKTIYKCNMKKHFYISKDFIQTQGINKNKGAIAIYPVLCSISNFEKPNWVSICREDIAKLAGISTILVDKGVEYLIEVGYLKRKKIVKDKARLYQYKVDFVRKASMEKEKGNYIKFYSHIIETGLWAQLSNRAQALYLAMRTVAKFDFENYVLGRGIANHEFNYQTEFESRTFDVCRLSLTTLCRLIGQLGDSIGMYAQNINQVLEELILSGLVVDFGKSTFAVYLIPKVMDEEDLLYI